MSKTTKIRRLNSQLRKLVSKVNSLEWSNSQLRRKLTTTPFKQYTQPPLIATGKYSEECEMERIKEAIDVFIVKLFDADFKAPKGGE
jgi:hypothetical protein